MMGSSPLANLVCWGSIIAIPLNLTIPAHQVGLRQERGSRVRGRTRRHADSAGGDPELACSIRGDSSLNGGSNR